LGEKNSEITPSSPGAQTTRSMFGSSPKSIVLHPAPVTIGRRGRISHGFN